MMLANIGPNGEPMEALLICLQNFLLQQIHF